MKYSLQFFLVSKEESSFVLAHRQAVLLFSAFVRNRDDSLEIRSQHGMKKMRDTKPNFFTDVLLPGSEVSRTSEFVAAPRTSEFESFESSIDDTIFQVVNIFVALSWE